MFSRFILTVIWIVGASLLIYLLLINYSSSHILLRVYLLSLISQAPECTKQSDHISVSFASWILSVMKRMMLGGPWHLTPLFLGTYLTPGKCMIFCTIYTTKAVANWLQKMVPLFIHTPTKLQLLPSRREVGLSLSHPWIWTGLVTCFSQKMKELIGWARKLKETACAMYLAQGQAHKSSLSGNNDHSEYI